MFAAELSEMLSIDMQKEGLSGRTLTLKLKTASFEVLSVFMMTHTLAACGRFRYMLNKIWNMWTTDFLLHLWCVSCFVCNKLSGTRMNNLTILCFILPTPYALWMIIQTKSSCSSLLISLQTANLQVRSRAVTMQKYICSREDILNHALKLLNAELPLSLRLIGRKKFVVLIHLLWNVVLWCPLL